MIHDAFSAGVEPGGLYSSKDIKILICYMLAGAGEPMPRQAVLDVIAGNGMANFFEASAAIDELLRVGSLAELPGERLTVSQTGAEAAATLSRSIPYTLRDRSVKASLQLLARIRREQENTVEKEKNGLGCQVTCRIGDEKAPLMTLKLSVADDLQAKLIREHFLDQPELLYRSVLAVLTGDAGMRRSDTQIVIDLK